MHIKYNRIFGTFVYDWGNKVKNSWGKNGRCLYSASLLLTLMACRALTSEMKCALRNLVERGGDTFKKVTMAALFNRRLLDGKGELTADGWKRAVELLPLEKQCLFLGIRYEKLEGLSFQSRPEFSAWKYLTSLGYTGTYCEGSAILLLIRAAALDTLAELNPFHSRADACTRFTEAQLKIHENHSQNILRSISKSTANLVAESLEEIIAPWIYKDSYPETTVETLLAIYTTLGAARLAEITKTIMEDPYQYRSGWPDLTMTNGEQMLWCEIKTTDKLHRSQITTLYRMKSLLPKEIRVTQLCKRKIRN